MSEIILKLGKLETELDRLDTRKSILDQLNQELVQKVEKIDGHVFENLLQEIFTSKIDFSPDYQSINIR